MRSNYMNNSKRNSFLLNVRNFFLSFSLFLGDFYNELVDRMTDEQKPMEPSLYIQKFKECIAFVYHLFFLVKFH